MSQIDNFFSSLKSIGKALLLSRPLNRCHKAEGQRIIIMANGPSLVDNIREDMDVLRSYPTMAVNYAGLAPEFEALRPRFYILADPLFFVKDASENQTLLSRRLSKLSWKMTLFVPAGKSKKARALYPGVADIVTFNAVGFEGFRTLAHAAFRMGIGMPRPRNVLIPAIMMAMRMGYREIYLLGADHSWMKTLSVNDENEVVSIQPHFYAENRSEQEKVRHDYRSIPLYKIVESFAVAFRSYHQIAAYARCQHIDIYNATPGSFIDAFPRRRLKAGS